MANDTKIAALFKPRTQRMHGSLERRIVEMLMHNPGTDYTRDTIATAVGKPVNCITAPVKSLLDAGTLIEDKRVRNPKTNALNWTLKLKET